MPETSQRNDGPGRRAASTLDRLNELARVLDAEAEVVDELETALWRQRAGVASNDTEAVNASVDAIGRILLTLEAARQRRTRLLEAIAGDPSMPLHRLEAALSCPLPPVLVEARAHLRRTAEQVTHEITVNRAVLHHAVDAGEAFLQSLFSSVVEPAPCSGPAERPEEPPPAGLLLSRRA